MTLDLGEGSCYLKEFSNSVLDDASHLCFHLSVVANQCRHVYSAMTGWSVSFDEASLDLVNHVDAFIEAVSAVQQVVFSCLSVVSAGACR